MAVRNKQLPDHNHNPKKLTIETPSLLLLVETKPSAPKEESKYPITITIASEYKKIID